MSIIKHREMRVIKYGNNWQETTVMDNIDKLNSRKKKRNKNKNLHAG